MTPVRLDRIGSGLGSAFLWQRLVLGSLLPTLPAVICFRLHEGICGLVWFVVMAMGIACQPFRAWVDERGLTFGWLWSRESFPLRCVLGAELTRDPRLWSFRRLDVLKIKLGRGDVLVWGAASELQRLLRALHSSNG